MWRLKRDGAKKDEEGGGDKKTAKPEEKKSVSDHASEASTEALKRAAADEKAKPEVREAAKKELEKRGAGKDDKKKTDEKQEVDEEQHDIDLGNKVAKQIIDDANDYYAHNGDYYGYADLESYIDSNDWADDVDTDEFDDGMEARQYVAQSLRSQIKSDEDDDGDEDDKKGDGEFTASTAADFLEEHADEYLNWQYGDIEDEDLDDKFDAAVKFIDDKKTKQFDGHEEDKMEKYVSSLESRGYRTIDVGGGSDTYVIIAIKDKSNQAKIDKKAAERKAEKERIDANRTKGFISALQSLSGANKNNSSNNNGGGSISENDVKSFLTQKLGADNVDDRLISGVMEVVKNNTKVNESHGEKLIDTALQQMGYESGHKIENRGEYAKKLSDWVNKFALKNDKAPSDMVDWLNDNMETLYNLDDLDDDELDKFSNIEGWDELNDIINDMSDAFENPDTEEADFENMFLGALKSDMGELDNSRKGKAAQKKLVDLARDFVNKNPDLKLTAEDWQDIIGGDVDESDEKYGKLKGFRKLSNAIERFYDSVD